MRLRNLIFLAIVVVILSFWVPLKVSAVNMEQQIHNDQLTTQLPMGTHNRGINLKPVLKEISSGTTLSSLQDAKPADYNRNNANSLRYYLAEDLELEPDGNVNAYDGQPTYTAKVKTPRGFLQAVYDPKIFATQAALNINSINGGKQCPTSHIDHIILQNDIDLVDWSDDSTAVSFFNIKQLTTTGGPYNSWKYVHALHDNLTIDGGVNPNFDGSDPNLTNGYSLNMGANAMALAGNGHNYQDLYDVNDSSKPRPYQENWTFKNINVYGITYWGVASTNSGIADNADKKHADFVDANGNFDAHLGGGYTKVTFDNFTYIGSQTLNSYNSSQYNSTVIDIKNKVNMYSVNKFNYKNQQYSAQDGGNQQNLECNKIHFYKGSRFNGYTYAGNCLDLVGTDGNSGKVQLDDDSIVNLYPHGSGERSNNGMAHGLVITGVKEQLLLSGNAQLNIEANVEPVKYDTSNTLDMTTPCGGLYLNGDVNSVIKFDDTIGSSPTINISSTDYDGKATPAGTGAIHANQPLVSLNKGQVIINHGSFNVQGNNLQAYTGNLLQIGAGMIIKIIKDGSFRIRSTGETTGALNLVNSDNGLDLGINNPKQVILDLKSNTNPNSNIINIAGKGTIDIRDSAFSANGLNSAGTNVTVDKIPMQQIKVPISRNQVDTGTIFSGEYPTVAKLTNLPVLKKALEDMGGSEFDRLELDGLSSPVIDNKTTEINPKQRIIEGTVDKYATDTGDFDPTPPALRLVVQRGSQTINLGTAANSAQGYSQVASGIVPFTPNLLSVDSEGKQNGQLDEANFGTQATDNQKIYVDNSAVTWSGNTYRIDIDKALAKYNQSVDATKQISSFKASDKIAVRAVTNFQGTPMQTMNVNNLYLGVPNQVDEYLMGEDVKIPLTYIDSDTTAQQIQLTGTLSGESTEAKNVTTTFPIADNKENVFNWKLSQATTVSDQAGSNHHIDFSGADIGPTPNNKYPFNGTDKVTYQYKVLPYPKYTASKFLEHTNLNGQTVPCGDNMMVTRFVPVGHQAMQKIQINLGADTVNITNQGTATITASYVDSNGEQISNTINAKGGAASYTAADWWSNLTSLPADTTFEVNQPVNISENLTDGASLKASADVLNAEDSSGKTYQLATSQSLNYQDENTEGYTLSEPDIALSVPDSLSFNAYLKHKEQTVLPNSSQATATLSSNITANQHVQLTTRVDDEKLGEIMYYRPNSSTPAALLHNDVLYDGTLTKDNPINMPITSADNQTGICIKLPAADEQFSMQKTSSLKWTAINSLS